MKLIRALLLLLIACLGGLLAAEALYRWDQSADAIREFAATFGVSPTPRADLLLRKNLRTSASDEVVEDAAIERELNLLRAQFSDDLSFSRALESSGLSSESLRSEVAENLRAQHWIEKQIAPETNITQEEIRQFYNDNEEQFAQPQRYRASHLFLAAPKGTPPEVIAAKQGAIQGLAVRLLAGEKLVQLAAEASEDEATKGRGGDLGYFVAKRVPPEFVAEVEKLRVGEISAPMRSHLGFHIVQLTDLRAPRELSFEEAKAEIAVAVTNVKRTAVVRRLRERLAAE